MTLDLRNPGDLQVTMVDLLKGVLEDLPEVITGISTILDANHLFQVSPEDKRTLLNKERATVFHHTVEHLIFFMSRARKDIKISMEFLCTQVRIPDEDDWGNLVRALRYIIGNLHLPLILRSNSLSVIKWWVNASFAAHPYCKCHTGAMMSKG